ncbi:hypothetical protein CAAN1_01S05842 [[Candida] anglica]|uniref:L-type lectin-like domain-containing protein n=1 Tax=[Candida] anglica TaxID=148631 RepID=A0ABP0EJP7_9ASCO
MGVITNVKRSRPLQGLIVFVLLVASYFFFFSSAGSDSYSPEEINSILQNKDKSVVSIKKTELTALGLSTPYLEKSSYKPRHWDVQGTALVKNHEYIRLTSDLQHQAGSIFSKLPIQAESFEMELTFHIHGKTKNGFVGDGLAIWFIDEKSDIGDVFGAKNQFNGLGIFIDTYKNGKRGQFPYVNLMLGDGQSSYNKHTDGFETRLAGCKVDVVNPESGKTKARLVYIKNGYFSLDFDYSGNGNDWRNCVTLNDVKLPQIKYLGISGETGGLSENNDIIENRVFALYKDDGSFVGSIDELEQMVAQQDEYEEEIPKKISNEGGRQRLFKKKRKDPSEQRRTLSRLRNSERRIKERERQLRLEKYGDAEATFFSNLLRKVWILLKYSFYFFLVILLAWVVFTVYRVQKQKNHRTTGLLD